MVKFQSVPPAPEVLTELYMEYLRRGKPAGVSFKQFLAIIGFTNPAGHVHGMDDAARRDIHAADVELIDVPKKPIIGELRVIVLLVDFNDRPAFQSSEHYEDLLFTEGIHPTGSLRDYYGEVSLGKVQVTGSVHGWLRMPRDYSFYVNGVSGTGNSYPRNAQGLAEDAVRTALQEGVAFASELDKLDSGTITALFIVHSGRGAERLKPAIGKHEIWSHKWALQTPVVVGEGLYADTYLVVPQECDLGVCAHELGHLAFQWQDFYDPNYDEDGNEWDGCGRWDLMAGGSYNGNGARPAHPAGLHKSQHNWIDVINIDKTTLGVALPPFTGDSGAVCRLRSPHFTKDQFLLLENRSRRGFDFDLPGEGLLVWKVDLKGEMFAAKNAGLTLVQADGRDDLANPDDWNQGDASDPFPGAEGIVSLNDFGPVSTSFDNKRSGIRITNIQRDFETGLISFDVIVGDEAEPISDNQPATEVIEG